jgi:hypothetical protein
MNASNRDGGRRLSSFDRLYQQASGKWTGCDWRTDFGRSGLNLEGIQSSQATLLAVATAGSESRDWYSAVLWLREVEQVTWEADQEARKATELARLGQLEEALHHAERACELERRYHTRLIWQPLRDAILDARDAWQRTR